MSGGEVHTEEDVVRPRRVLQVFIGAVVLGVILCLIAWALLLLREWQLRPSGQFPERDYPSPHRVAEVREEEFAVVPARPSRNLEDKEVLQSFGWVDQTHGIVRVPIDVAMDLYLNGVRP